MAQEIFLSGQGLPAPPPLRSYIELYMKVNFISLFKNISYMGIDQHKLFIFKAANQGFRDWRKNPNVQKKGKISLSAAPPKKNPGYGPHGTHI